MTTSFSDAQKMLDIFPGDEENILNSIDPECFNTLRNKIVDINSINRHENTVYYLYSQIFGEYSDSIPQTKVAVKELDERVGKYNSITKDVPLKKYTKIKNLF